MTEAERKAITIIEEDLTIAFGRLREHYGDKENLVAPPIRKALDEVRAILTRDEPTPSERPWSIDQDFDQHERVQIGKDWLAELEPTRDEPTCPTCKGSGGAPSYERALNDHVTTELGYRMEELEALASLADAVVLESSNPDVIPEPLNRRIVALGAWLKKHFDVEVEDSTPSPEPTQED